MAEARVVLEAVHCTISIRQPSTRVLVLEIRGHDVGELEERPLRALDELLAPGQSELFIDARDALGPSLGVSAGWAHWLRSRRERLSSVRMLTSSRFVRLTADFVKRFAELGETMRIYTDAVEFDAALAQASTR